MRLHAVVFAWALLAGCRMAPLGEGPDRYRLGPGSSLDVSKEADGRPRIDVVIPSGQRGAGHYVSHAPELVATAQDAHTALGDPDGSVVVQIDGAGNLVQIQWQQTGDPEWALPWSR